MGQKLVIVTGSSRPDGNTEQAAEVIKKRWASIRDNSEADVNIIKLREHFIKSCGYSETCGDCNSRLSPCLRNDDDAAAIIEKMIEADAIIYGSPTYGFGTPSLMQTFIERSGVGYLRFSRPLQYKVGGVYVTAHKFNAGAVHDQIVNNLLLNQVIIPGSGFPAILQGGRPGSGFTDYKGVASMVKMVERIYEVSAALSGIEFNQSPNETQRDIDYLARLVADINPEAAKNMLEEYQRDNPSNNDNNPLLGV